MVNNVLIFAAPGQGAQTPGFLSPWLEIPGLTEKFGAWSELAGRDLIRLGTTGSAAAITDTAWASSRPARSQASCPPWTPSG